MSSCQFERSSPVPLAFHFLGNPSHHLGPFLARQAVSGGRKRPFLSGQPPLPFIGPSLSGPLGTGH